MTKEKVLVLLIAITMLIIAILPTTVKAEIEEEEEVWTDLSNAKIEIIGVPQGNKSMEDATLITYKVRISDVTLNPEHWYSVYFHEKDTEIKSGFAVKSVAQANLKDGETETTITLAELFLQKNTDIYVTIAEGEPISTNPKIVLEAIKIDHPELLPKLGNRFHIFFSKTSTDTYFWAPNVTKNGGQVDRTLKVKIGQVTDTEILKKIKESKAQGLAELLDYAKKVTNYNYTGTIEYKHDGKPAITGITESLTSEMNLSDTAYYFAYIELDDEGGVYYPVEDIALYKARGTTELVRFSNKDFTWDIEQTDNTTKDDKEKDKIEVVENKEKDKTTDNTVVSGSIPQTGEKAIYLIIVLVVTLTMIGYIKYKQYKDI